MSPPFTLESMNIRVNASPQSSSLKAHQQQRQQQSDAAKTLILRALAQRHIASGALVRHDERWSIRQQSLPSIAVSHAHTWVQCAVDSDHPCAIDVESTTRHIDIAYALKHFFHPQIHSILAPWPSKIQKSAFFIIWTALEAQGKLLGLDLNQTLAHVLFSENHCMMPIKNYPNHRWFVRWLDRHHVSAVLCHRVRAPQLLTWQWRPLRDAQDLYALSHHVKVS